MKQIKKAYDLWDMPPEVQVKTPPAPLAPVPKLKKKPGPKPRVEPVAVEVAPAAESKPSQSLIEGLVRDLRKFFTKVQIRDVKPRIVPTETAPTVYISNIVLGNERIGFLEQPVGSSRVYLKFEKGSNIPIFHEGDDVEKFADKINQEIEKNYTKKLAAKVGYRTAIKVVANRRRM